MDDLQRSARDLFGIDGLRPQQLDAIRAFLADRDVVVLLPTGFGKSVCYQLPGVLDPTGPTLVVSPLVALMEDQVSRLRANGLACAALHRATPARERDRVLSGDTPVHLLYASPERVAQPAFRRKLRALGVTRVAVDEAHCVSEWGHDFRPEYLQLGVLRAELGRPTMALTATATPRVAAEIERSLGLVDPLRVQVPFRRPNLALEVEHHRGDKARLERLIAMLIERGLGRSPDRGRVVVYVATRARTRATAEALTSAGMSVAYYHAGRTDAARTRAQERFGDGAAAVMVATTAFGMGIDQPDVRLVVHAQAPGSLEAYAQQAGRAGRDGAPATCVLLYAPGDAVTAARLRGKAPFPGAVEGWRALQDYAFGTRCREVTIALHFGGEVEACGRCDVCRRGTEVAAVVDAVRTERRAAVQAKARRDAADRAVVLDDAQRAIVLSFVDGLRKPVGKRLVASGLRGGRSKRAVKLGLPANPAFGQLRGVPELAILAALDDLLADGTLVAKGKKYPTVWMPAKRVRAAPGTGAKRPREVGLRGALRELRKRESRRRRWKPYQVFPDATLDAIVKDRPADLASLGAIFGLGPARIEKFGASILTLVREHPE
ncbi:MAG: RecQ family ATP-dependent DNA helicase [Myxococcota bacterium]